MQWKSSGNDVVGSSGQSWICQVQNRMSTTCLIKTFIPWCYTVIWPKYSKEAPSSRWKCHLCCFQFVARIKVTAIPWQAKPRVALCAFCRRGENTKRFNSNKNQTWHFFRVYILKRQQTTKKSFCFSLKFTAVLVTIITLNQSLNQKVGNGLIHDFHLSRVPLPKAVLHHHQKRFLKVLKQKKCWKFYSLEFFRLTLKYFGLKPWNLLW